MKFSQTLCITTTLSFLLGTSIFASGQTGVHSPPGNNAPCRCHHPKHKVPPHQAAMPAQTPDRSASFPTQGSTSIPKPAGSSAQVQPQNAASAATWDTPLVIALANSGLTLLSVSFAAFTFLFGALITLRDAPVDDLRSKLLLALYSAAGICVAAAAISIFSNVAVLSHVRSPGLAAIVLAALILLAVPSIAVFLAVIVFLSRRT